MLAGCGSGPADPTGLHQTRLDGGVIFLALSEPPDAHMEALFEGPVVQDAAGCLRLGGDGGSTVVWPYGATLDGSGDALRVKDGAGAVIGTIGSDFRFGGGHVPSLHAGIRLTEADRARAASCPGDFWIVGEIYPR